MAAPDQGDLNSPVRNRVADDANFIRRWDDDVVRAARSRARRGGYRVDPDDLAQEARLRVLTIARSSTKAVPPRYMRKVIFNAVLAAALHRARAELPPASDVGLVIAEDAPDVYAVAAVRGWIATLPAPLRAVYDALYGQDLTQREAASLIGVSQPRVAQLHQALLDQARIGLRHIAA